MQALRFAARENLDAGIRGSTTAPFPTALYGFP